MIIAIHFFEYENMGKNRVVSNGRENRLVQVHEVTYLVEVYRVP